MKAGTRTRSGQDRRTEFQRLQTKGLSLAELASRLGVTVRTVSRYREEFGLSEPNPYGQRRVDDAWLAQVKQMFDDGCSVSEVCRTMNSTWETVKRHFPDSGWDPSETGVYARAVRTANAELRKQGLRPLPNARHHH